VCAWVVVKIHKRVSNKRVSNNTCLYVCVCKRMCVCVCVCYVGVGWVLIPMCVCACVHTHTEARSNFWPSGAL